MSELCPSNVFAEPLHVYVSPAGVIKVFLPNGDSIVLTADAAARSAAMLGRAAAGLRGRIAAKRRRGNQVIAVDFAGLSRRA